MTTDARPQPLVQMLRLPGTFAAWSSILAAHAIATGGWPHWWVLGLQLGAIAALYWGGMILNDCFDLPRDRERHPNRPLPSGRIALRTAWVLGGGLLVLGVALAGLAGGPSLRVAVALAAVVLLYNALLKGALLGPLALGATRYLTWTLGLSVLATTGGLRWVALPVLLYTAAIGVLRGAPADGPDPRTVGKTLSLLAASLVFVIMLVLSGVLPERLALIALVPALYPLVIGLWRLRRGGPEAAQSLVRVLILGLIPLDALLVLASGHWLWALAVLALMLPQRTLLRRVGSDWD